MDVSSQHEVTELLLAWGQGEESALKQLIPLVHAELRRLGHRHMAGERRDHTLQTTALVNEAYVRLVDCQRVNWQNRAHFFAVSAQLMRRILVDFARSRRYLKRGGGAQRISLDEGLVVSRQRGEERLGCHRFQKEPVGRAAFFWRAEYKGNGRGAEGFRGNGRARLETRQSLAFSRAQLGEDG